MREPTTRQYTFLVSFSRKNPNKPGSIKIDHVGKGPEDCHKIASSCCIPSIEIAKHITEKVVQCEREEIGTDPVPVTLLPCGKSYKQTHMIKELEKSIDRGLTYIADEISDHGRLYNGTIEINLWWLNGQTNRISATMDCIIDDDPAHGIIVEKKLEVTV